MAENSQLENVLREADHAIHKNMPSFIKNAKALFRYEHIGTYGSELILMGFVYIRIETEDKYAIHNCYGFSETYGTERTKEEAEQCILKSLLSYHEAEDREFDMFWEKTKIDEERWMDKAIDMDRFFSILDSFHVGLWKNMPLYVENAFISFDPTKEMKPSNPKEENGTISLHVVTDKSNFALDWKKCWHSSEEKDSNLAFCSWAETIIEKGDYYRIWDRIDFENEEWKDNTPI